MSNGLDPDQERHSVGLDLGPNCLQRLSRAAKVATGLKNEFDFLKVHGIMNTSGLLQS